MLMAQPEKELSRDEGKYNKHMQDSEKKEEENGCESLWPGKGLERREEW